MREIVVISGKGGTGKTSVCAAFSHLARNAVICDLDVDAPDLHILLDPRVRSSEPFISGNTAVVEASLCTGCGRCAELCRFGAASRSDGKAVVDELRCEGCGAVSYTHLIQELFGSGVTGHPGRFSAGYHYGARCFSA